MSQEIVGPLTVTSPLGVQGGSLELGATLGAPPETPYVDFHFGTGAAQDFNVRLINPANNQLDVVTEAGGPVLSVHADKVGIGTTSPAAKLVVHEPAGGAEVRVDGNGGLIGLSLGADAAQPWVGTRTNHALRLLTNNTEQVRVQANGHVGIGTPQPSQKLTLGSGNMLLPNANAGLHGNLYFGGITDAGQTGLRFFGGLVNGTIPAGFIDVRTTDPNDGLRIRVDTTNGSAERMRVTAGGNVGIGTPNPAAPFHVASYMAVGPFAPTTGQGGIDVTGSAAEFSFVDRRLTSWPANPQPGDRFVWYNIDRIARLWAHASGDVLTVTSDGNVVYRGALNKLEIADNFTATVRCGDFCIGHSGRRGTPGRALVDSTTVLTLNWGNDWPQGVRYYGQLAAVSSRALKENIADVSGGEALEALDGLQPVKFHFKSDKQKILQIGFIAEDVPSAVATPDRQGVVTSHIVAVLTKVVQDQQTLLTQLSSKVKRLEAITTHGSV